HHVAFQVLGETLADNGRGNTATTEAGQAGQLLVFLHQGIGFPGNFVGGNLNLDFSPRGAGFCGAHIPSVKREREHRQTAAALLLRPLRGKIDSAHTPWEYRQKRPGPTVRIWEDEVACLPRRPPGSTSLIAK